MDVSDFRGGPHGPIFLDHLLCSGQETDLSNCGYSTIHMCTHQNDVGIICHGKRSVYVANRVLNLC